MSPPTVPPQDVGQDSAGRHVPAGWFFVLVGRRQHFNLAGEQNLGRRAQNIRDARRHNVFDRGILFLGHVRDSFGFVFQGEHRVHELVDHLVRKRRQELLEDGQMRFAAAFRSCAPYPVACCNNRTLTWPAFFSASSERIGRRRMSDAHHRLQHKLPFVRHCAYLELLGEKAVAGRVSRPREMADKLK